jgi:hypothetical protein
VSCPSGCCSGDTCLPGNSDFACGFGGGQCETCIGMQYCSGGICQGSPCPCFMCNPSCPSQCWNENCN